MNNYKLTVLEGEDARKAADKALKARLYVSGWRLSGDLVRIRMGWLEAKVVIVEEEDKPIAVGVQRLGGETEIFVRKSYRKRGVGRMIASTVKSDKSFADEGIDGSIEFWKKVGYGVPMYSRFE